MASKQLSKDPLAGLPDLVQTNADDFNIDARDVQPPRIKAASPTSAAAADGHVPLFCLYATKGQDDDEPVELVPPLKDGDLANPDFGFPIYILRMFKTKSANVNPVNWMEEMRNGGQFRSWAFDDTSAPPFARTDYNYVVYAPESPDDEDMPHNLLLGKSSTPTARMINTLLMQRQAEGRPLYTQPFRLYAEKREAQREGQTNRWAVVKARPVQPTAEQVSRAQEMYQLVVATRPEQDRPATSNGSAPAI